MSEPRKEDIEDDGFITVYPQPDDPEPSAD